MQTKKKIIILGASRYYQRSIEAAKSAGYHIIAVDRNPDSAGFKSASEHFVCDIVDKEAVFSLARSCQISGIVPVNDYGVPTAAYVSSKLNLPGITEETALLATNKEEMRKKWLERGVPCPKVDIASSREGIIDAAHSIGFPCILKPAHGIGGASRGVVVVQSKNELESAITFCQSFYEDKATLVESFIESEIEHSAEVLIHDGKVHVIAISDKVKTPLPYRVDKCVLYPSQVTGIKKKQLVSTICDAVTSLGINTGAAHVELASSKKGPILFELGARCGGGGTPEPIVPFVTGINLFVELVRILAGDEPENLTPLWEKGCNYHFITLKPGLIKKIENFEAIMRHPAVLDCELLVKENDNIPVVKVGGDRSGFIIVGSETRNGSLQIGQELENSISVEYK